MKRMVSVLLAVAVIAVGGTWVYAMNCHDGDHDSGGSGSHMMGSSEGNKMNHDDNSVNMVHNKGMKHDFSYDKEDLVSVREAERSVDEFLSSNMRGYEVREIWFVDGDMMTPPMYEADIILANGLKGIIMVDALTGEPTGVLVGKYVEIMRSAGRQDMKDMGAPSDMHGDNTGMSGSDDMADHSTHNH